MHRPTLVPLVLLVLAPPTVTAADVLRIPPGVELEEGVEADAVLRAVQGGELMPLGRVLDILRTERQGEVVEIELDVDDGRVIYDFDVLTSEGRLYAVAIDAVTGQVVEVELEDEDDHDDDDED
jgi:uncharacterized membrane protein YkoI